MHGWRYSFFREVDDEGLIQLQSAEIADWLALLKRQPALAASVALLEQKIAALSLRQDAQLELAADFLRIVPDDG